MKGVRHYPGFLAITVLCLTILYAPLIVIMAYSFNGPQPDGRCRSNWRRM